ncbi:MAG: peptidoglycan DD-metalloendopeptidase family protein [Crocinitomicaceae bacterium]
MLPNILLQNQHRFAKVFDFEMTRENTLRLNLSKENINISKEVIYDPASQEKFVRDQLQQVNARVGVGGYLENRNLYSRSAMFDNEHDSRTIHLGIDLWIEAGTKVYTPYEGEVFSVKNNAGVGDYGPTIILKHELDGVVFYSLYGHLSLDSIRNLKKDDVFSTGDELCEIGNYPENGHWAPHLHFQLMTNMDNFSDGDYPAVCTENDKAKFANYCPNPELMLQIPTLD